MALTRRTGASGPCGGIREAKASSRWVGDVFWRAACECEAKKRRLVDLGEDWGARELEDKSESEKLTAASWPREGGDPARF